MFNKSIVPALTPIGNAEPHLFVIQPDTLAVHLLVDVPAAGGHLRLTICTRTQLDEMVSALLAAADVAWPETADSLLVACALCGVAITVEESHLASEGFICHDCAAAYVPLVGLHD